MHSKSRSKIFTLDKDREFFCNACDNLYPCAYTHANGQQLCGCCTSQLDGISKDDVHPCEHIECSLIDCEHAILNPSDSAYMESDDRDVMVDEWYQPKKEWT